MDQTDPDPQHCYKHTNKNLEAGHFYYVKMLTGKDVKALAGTGEDVVGHNSHRHRVHDGMPAPPHLLTTSSLILYNLSEMVRKSANSCVHSGIANFLGVPVRKFL
jgi:hypothetical protein